MKRLLLGLILPCLLLPAFASAASAAEIPPTAECTSTFKTVIKKVVREGGEPEDGERRFQRKYAQELFDAGCVSAVEPIVKNLPTKPDSAECRDASAAADDYWSPIEERLDSAYKAEAVRLKPATRKYRRLTARIKKLREQGGAEKKVKRLIAERARVTAKAKKLIRATDRRLKPIYVREAYRSTLTLYELLSLRCLNDASLKPDAKPDGPAARVLQRNSDIAFRSYGYIVDGTV